MGAIDVNRTWHGLTCFVNVRHWWYKDSGTLAILKPADCNDISISMVLHFVQSVGQLNASAKVCTEDWKRSGTRVTVVPALLYCTLLFPNWDITFHSLYPQSHQQVHKPFQNKTRGQQLVLITVKSTAKIRYLTLYLCGGMWWRSWLRHCATSRKVVGSIPDGVTGIFHWHNSSGHTVTLGLTLPLTEMSTRNISWG